MPTAEQAQAEAEAAIPVDDHDPCEPLDDWDRDNPDMEVGTVVAKMASHAIFQYNILAIDDTHNTWTNMIVKINIPRLLGSSDDKEKIGAARPEGPPLRGFR